MSEQHTDTDAAAGAETRPAAERAGAALYDTVRNLGSETTELGGQIYEQGVRSAHAVSRTAGSQPLSAVAIAGAIGLLLGFLLGRTA